VRATKLSGADKVIQLLEFCDKQLRRDLTCNARGTLTEKSEEEVLAAMKVLAVREENVVVARVTLHNMKQDRGKPICPTEQTSRAGWCVSVYAKMYKL